MRKSKKRSAVNSKPQLEDPTRFLDRNLGRHIIAKQFRLEGMKVEVHDDHFPLGAPDEEWLAHAWNMNWVAVTMDKNIRYWPV